MSQSVNFGSASFVNFNGSSVSQVNLNGSQIWAGTSTFTSTFSDATEGKISVQRMGYKSSVMPNEGSFDSSRGSPGANRNQGLSGGAVFEGIWLESIGSSIYDTYVALELMTTALVMASACLASEFTVDSGRLTTSCH